jgi:hypothetical protein
MIFLLRLQYLLFIITFHQAIVMICCCYCLSSTLLCPLFIIVSYVMWCGHAQVAGCFYFKSCLCADS